MYYSITFDETTDISNDTNFKIYFWLKNKKDFISFINCDTYFYNKQKSNQEENINDSEEYIDNYEKNIIELKLTGDILGKKAIYILKNLNFNLETLCWNCYWWLFGYDIHSSWSCKIYSIKATPNAVYSPYSNNCLNLLNSKSSSNSCQLKMMSLLLKKLYIFLICQPKEIMSYE